jgi:hypothetical protein
MLSSPEDPPKGCTATEAHIESLFYSLREKSSTRHALLHVWLCLRYNQLQVNVRSRNLLEETALFKLEMLHTYDTMSVRRATVHMLVPEDVVLS